MPYRFSPFTGTLDYYEEGSTDNGSSAPVSGSITRTGGLLASVTYGDDVHTINRTDGVITGWESDNYIVTLTREEGIITSWSAVEK